MEIEGGAGEKGEDILEVHLNTQIHGRPRLRELDVNVCTEGAKQPENMGQTKQGRWKRRGQGERKELENKENRSDIGAKRGREIEDPTEVKHLEEGIRHKCLKLERSSNSPMVEDPSHNWTQIYK